MAMNQKTLKVKKNNIWSDTLIEESLCNDIGLFSSIKNDENVIKVSDRDVESYQYSNEEMTKNSNEAATTATVAKKNHLAIDSNLVNFVSKEPSLLKSGQNKKETLSGNNNEKSELKNRLGGLVTFDENKSRAHININEFDSEDIVASKIAKYLKENNMELMLRIVKVLGRTKALEILYATEDIQEIGGMPTAEGNRSRTPGGCYIQLVRKDDRILSCQRKQIFIEDAIKKKNQKKLKRLAQAAKFNREKKQLAETIKNDKDIKADLKTRLGSGAVVTGQVDVNCTNQIEETIEDEMENIEENQMIYFDE